MSVGQLQTRSDRLHSAVCDRAFVCHIPIYYGQNSCSRPAFSIAPNGLQIVERFIAVKFARDGIELGIDVTKWFCVFELGYI
jgi:hypothetical protein